MKPPMYTIHTSTGTCVCWSEHDLASNLAYALKESLRVLRVARHETVEQPRLVKVKVAS